MSLRRKYVLHITFIYITFIMVQQFDNFFPEHAYSAIINRMDMYYDVSILFFFTARVKSTALMSIVIQSTLQK